MEVAAILVIAAAWAFRERVSVLERREWTSERQLLLDRIQAPEKAIYRDFDPPKKQHVGFDDDADYWASKRENGEMS